MRVVHMSGYADSPSAYPGSPQGTFFEKPVVPESFLRGLRKVLTQAR